MTEMFDLVPSVLRLKCHHSNVIFAIDAAGNFVLNVKVLQLVQIAIFGAQCCASCAFVELSIPTSLIPKAGVYQLLVHNLYLVIFGP